MAGVLMVQMIKVPSGNYLIGTNSADGFVKDKEGPQVEIQLESFEISCTTITNQEFQQFVQETGYVTEAEQYGWSYVFHYFLTMEEKLKAAEIPGLNWWYAVQGANWKHPEGKSSNLKDRLNHPVVHVSRNDALAYCEWSGTRLPTEAEWEVAAKGGTTYERYPWGEEFLKNNEYHCNIWQGNFPLTNTLDDGFDSTAPAKYYEPNNYGLYQMVGNVWEWCLNPQGIDLEEFQQKLSADFVEKNQTRDDKAYAIRGGSFLCHESYCKRYRIAARSGNTGDSTSNNMGFRVVRQATI